MIRETCEYVPITSLVPKEWATWFYFAISDAPFTWGANSRSLVTARRLLYHVEKVIYDSAALAGVTEEQVAGFLQLLESLEDTYIDLEN